MVDKVRCPSCRGAKKVPKLGGMIGECNTCKGDGQVNPRDIPPPVKVEALPIEHEIVKAVSECIPASTREIQSAPVEGNIPVAKIQAAVNSVSAKKNIYRKKA